MTGIFARMTGGLRSLWRRMRGGRRFVAEPSTALVSVMLRRFAEEPEPRENPKAESELRQNYQKSEIMLRDLRS